MSGDHGERLASLETRMQSLEKKADEHRRKSDMITEELQEIKSILQSQKGFIAGVTIAVTSVVGLLGYFLNLFKH
jgi:chromosome segregation ATPase